MSTAEANPPLDPESLDYMFRNTKTYCTHCRVSQDDVNADQGRLMRCSRCKVALYCSAKCQKKNQVLHKVICKQIAHQDDRMKELEVQVRACRIQKDVTGNHNKPITELFTDHVGEFGSFPVAKEYLVSKRILAKTILEMAYVSTDTVERGAFMYEMALRHYYEVFRLDANLFLGVQEAVVLLFAILGYDDACYSIIIYLVNPGKYTHNGSTNPNGTPMRLPCDPVLAEHWTFPWLSARNTIEMEHVDHHQTLYLSAMLLIKMRMLAACQRGDGDADMKAFFTTPAGLRLEQETRCIFEALYKYEPRALIHLLHESDPLSHEQVNKVFDIGGLRERGDELESLVGDERPAMVQLDHEIWLLLKDAYALTPGVMNLLEEYVDGQLPLE